MTRIAIVGLSSSGADAPFGNELWQVWGVAYDPEHRHKCDRLFEMHLGKEIPEVDAPVYVQQSQVDGQITYPLDAVADNLGRDWFASGISYMLGLAIKRNPDVIGLWGVHMEDSKEYEHQRDNLSWMLGLAEGRGIRVLLPAGCQLLRYRPRGDCPERYGYL